MKTDTQLKRDVEAELAWDPAAKSSPVGVVVRNGVVTLAGHVETFADKYAVERAARRVAGVRSLALELDVRLAPGHRRSDSEIAAAVEQALRSQNLLPANHVQVSVENGWVTLRGEVDWDYQRKSIEKAIRPLVGVVGLSDYITLEAQPVPQDLHRRIEEALARQAAREAGRIKVTVEGSTVTLQGEAHSAAEREAATGVVWGAPGVAKVVN